MRDVTVSIALLLTVPSSCGLVRGAPPVGHVVRASSLRLVVLSLNRHGKMADGTSRAGNALQKRQESLKRWKGSETDRQPVDRSKKKAKIKFNAGIVFLSAVSSGDVDEVKKLLAKGTDIDFQNIDGLTALHQVCTVQLWTSGLREYIWKVSVAVGLLLNLL